MRPGLVVGSETEIQWQVTAEHVIHLGYPPPSNPQAWLTPNATYRGTSVAVFSTPNMILMMERAARKALEPFLEPGEESASKSALTLGLETGKDSASTSALTLVPG